jgi:hypothetical protein
MSRTGKIYRPEPAAAAWRPSRCPAEHVRVTFLYDFGPDYCGQRRPADASVHVQPYRVGFGTTTKTGTDGRYSACGPPASRVGLQIGREGYATAFKYDLPARDQTIDVALQPSFEAPVGGMVTGVIRGDEFQGGDDEFGGCAGAHCAGSSVSATGTVRARFGARRSRSDGTMLRPGWHSISPTRTFTFRHRLYHQALASAVQALWSRRIRSTPTSIDSQSGLRKPTAHHLDRINVRHLS